MARLLYHRRREARGLVHPVGAVSLRCRGAGLSQSRHPHGDRHLAGRRDRSLRPPDGRGPVAEARPDGVRRQQARRLGQPRHRFPGARAGGRLHADDRFRRRHGGEAVPRKRAHLRRDERLAPVFNIAETAHILVVPPTLPRRTSREFIAYAKAQPKPSRTARAGFGSPPHLSMALFAQAAGLKMVHVPYKGVGGAMPDLLAGRMQAMSMALGSARAYLKGGQTAPARRRRETPHRRIAGRADVRRGGPAALGDERVVRRLRATRHANGHRSRAERKTPASARRPQSKGAPLRRRRRADRRLGRIFDERFRADHRMWGDFIRKRASGGVTRMALSRLASSPMARSARRTSRRRAQFYEEFLGLEVVRTSPVSLMIRLAGNHVYAVVLTKNKTHAALLSQRPRRRQRGRRRCSLQALHRAGGEVGPARDHKTSRAPRHLQLPLLGRRRQRLGDPLNPKGGYTWIFEQGDLEGRGHFTQGFKERHRTSNRTGYVIVLSG